LGTMQAGPHFTNRAGDGSRRSPGTPDAMNLYLRELAGIPPLDEAEEQALRRRLRHGDEAARQRLAESGLPLAFSLARRKSRQIGGRLLADLVSEANLTVARLGRTFEPDAPHPFGVYVYFQVRQALTRAVGTMIRPVRVPGSVQRLERREHEACRELRQRLRREPRRGEIASELGVPVAHVDRIPASPWTTPEPDAPGTPPVTACGPSPEDEAIRISDAAWVRGALDRLRPSDRSVVGRRFGLEDDTPLSCADIGRHDGVSRQAARERCHAALRRLARLMRGQARAS